MNCIHQRPTGNSAARAISARYAAWPQTARIQALANGRGAVQLSPEPSEPRPALHVTVKGHTFHLAWRRAGTVLDERELERKPLALPDGTVRYPSFARARRAISGEMDPECIRARRLASSTLSLHTPNSVGFGELIGVIDAVRRAKAARRMSRLTRGRRARDS